MSLVRFCSPLLLAAPLTASAAAQVTAGDFSVVTTDGVFHFDPTSGGPATLVAPASMFGVLVEPSIEWNPLWNRFLVASGNTLYDVDLSGGGATVTDLQPAIPATARLVDIDINPASGELFALDADSGTVWRFAQNFFVGMPPVGSIGPVATDSTAMCVDSRGYPLAVIVAEPTRVARHELDGSSSTVLTLQSIGGLDMNTVSLDGLRHTYFCKGSSGAIGRSLPDTPSAYISLQQDCVISLVVRDPQDIEWDATRGEYFSLAQDGMDPCFPGHTGVQIARHYWVVVAPGTLAKATEPMTPPVSGITGSDGDLSAVGGIYALVHLYGDGCPAPSGQEPLADATRPYLGQSNDVFLSNATAGKTAYLGVGSAPTAIPAYGCTILTSGNWGTLGPVVVDANGAATVSYTLPNDPALVGVNIFAQWSILEGPSPIFSHGVWLRVGMP